jgi:hypothetical protein
MLLREKDGGMYDTDTVPTSQDVCGDFGVMREQVGVGSWKGVFFKRQYAFGEKGAR